MIRRLALSKGKIYSALAVLAVVAALLAALGIQDARLSFAQLERDTARELHDRAAAQLQAAGEHRRRTEAALTARQEALQASIRQSQTLRGQLQQLSQRIDDENWQACRNVRTPDALLYGVRTEH